MNLTVDKNISWSILLSLVTSCATLEKPLLSKDEVALTKDNIKLLNGTCYRDSKDTTWCWVAHNDLSWNLYWLINKGDRVGLLVVHDRLIRVTILDGCDTTRSKVFKGQIKDGHFEFRRRLRVIPALILNLFWNSKQD